MHNVCTPQEAMDTAVAAAFTEEAQAIVEQAEYVEELEDCIELLGTRGRFRRHVEYGAIVFRASDFTLKVAGRIAELSTG